MYFKKVDMFKEKIIWKLKFYIFFYYLIEIETSNI